MGSFGWHWFLGIVDFAHDQEQPVASGRRRVSRQPLVVDLPLLPEQEDVGQRGHRREDDVRGGELHRDVGPLDAVEQVRLVEKDELQERMFLGESHTELQDAPDGRAEDEREEGAGLNDAPEHDPPPRQLSGRLLFGDAQRAA